MTTISDLEGYNRRAQAATAAGAQALVRLLDLVEQHDSGQTATIRKFLRWLTVGETFEPVDLRALDVAISDDMLAVLDAVRWGRVAVEHLVPQGEQRLLAHSAGTNGR